VTASSLRVANGEIEAPQTAQIGWDSYGSFRFDPIRDGPAMAWQSRGRRFDPVQLHHF